MNNLFKISIVSIVCLLNSFTMTMDRHHEYSSLSALFAQEAKKRSTETKTVVPMWGAMHRFNQVNNIVDNTMETSGLDGCIATAVLVRYLNGSSCSVMTHFAPIDTSEHAKQLKKQLLKCNKKAQSPIVSSHLIVAKPEEYILNAQTKRYELEQSNKYDQILTSTHSVIQGDCAKFSLLSYSEVKESISKSDESSSNFTCSDLQLAMKKDGNAALYCNICTRYKTDL